MTDDLLDLAVTAARAAGVLLRERFHAPRTDVDTKSSATDMVTDADRAAEALIKEGIQLAPKYVDLSLIEDAKKRLDK